MSKKEYISLDLVKRDCDYLADRIVQEGYLFDLIIGISRGGLIPSVLLSHALNVKTVKTIDCESYDEFNNRKSVVVNCDFNPKDLSDHSILVVDDIYDSGLTIKEVKSRFNELNCKYLCLVTKQFNPQIDFYARECVPDRWVIFPWEKDS